jgi:hypothetical protein
METAIAQKKPASIWRPALSLFSGYYESRVSLSRRMVWLLRSSSDVVQYYGAAYGHVLVLIPKVGERVP